MTERERMAANTCRHGNTGECDQCGGNMAREELAPVPADVSISEAHRRAAIHALIVLSKRIEDMAPCGHSCVIARPVGMSTNGPCRCLEDTMRLVRELLMEARRVPAEELRPQAHQLGQQCEHGSLARSCQVCELTRERDEWRQSARTFATEWARTRGECGELRAALAGVASSNPCTLQVVGGREICVPHDTAAPCPHGIARGLLGWDERSVQRRYRLGQRCECLDTDEDRLCDVCRDDEERRRRG